MRDPMPTNSIKVYAELLEIGHLNPSDRIISLRTIFKRDIEENPLFNFLGKVIRPTKKEGQDSMEVLFTHLTCRDEIDEKGKKTGSRLFEIARSMRLHWIKHHIELKNQDVIDIFSFTDRIKGKDVIRTYIHDIPEKYVIILEPQRSNKDYYLITAYHLNEPGGERQIIKKGKKRLSTIY